MDKNAFRQYLHEEYEKPFTGWDFSYIEHRIVTSPLDWSYPSLLLPRIREVRSMLDIDTGGGELLSMFAPLPVFTCATEAYEPNIPIARERLEPLGVQVYSCSSENDLPFAEGQFELVTNRHGAYQPREVWRILVPTGIFVTQQVGVENNLDINRLLGAPTEMPWENWRLDFAVGQLAAEGFAIKRALECFPETRIFDVGALVYYLSAIPWQIPDFKIDKYLDPLWDLYRQIEREGFFPIRSHRFMIEAVKKR